MECETSDKTRLYLSPAREIRELQAAAIAVGHTVLVLRMIHYSIFMGFVDNN